MAEQPRENEEPNVDQGRVFEAGKPTGPEGKLNDALAGAEGKEAQDPVENQEWFGKARKFFREKKQEAAEGVKNYLKDRKEAFGDLRDSLNPENITEEGKGRFDEWVEDLKKMTNGELPMSEEDKEFLKSDKAKVVPDLMILGAAAYMKVTKFGILKLLWTLAKKKGKMSFGEGFEIGKNALDFGEKKGK